MRKGNILVIDDEEDLLELIEYNLAKEGYQVSTVTSGERALDMVRQTPPQLILLDWMLPGLDGLEICKRLKSDRKTQNIPIIMISAKGEDVDLVTGLEIGADDYIPKPFSPRVLLARVKNALRRKNNSSSDEPQILNFPNLEIHCDRYEVMVKGKAIELTPTEFRLLVCLAKKPGWVFSRKHLIKTVHGEDYPVTDRSVDVQIVGLRKKMGAVGDLIETVRGVGYRFRS